MLTILVARLGLVGVCLIGGSVPATSARGQEPVSSRRSGSQMPPQIPVPIAQLIEDEPDANDPTPTRLPSTQADALSENFSPQPAGEYVDPAMSEGRVADGRPVNLHGYGLKRRMQDCYWGYPEEFCERPFGISNRAAYYTMIGNGLGDYLILYQYDFHDGSQGVASQLNDAGITRLQRIVRMLHGNPRSSIVVVENIPGELRLSRARQQEVAAQLARMGIDERTAAVMLGRPRRGLLGDEAIGNYRNMINLSNSQGSSSGMGGGGSGGSQPTLLQAR